MKKILRKLLLLVSLLSLKTDFCVDKAPEQSCNIQGLAGEQPKHVCDLRDFFKNMQKYADTYPHNIVLFQGPSGVGKSVGAEKFSYEITPNVCKYSASDLVKPDPGESAAFIRELYKKASQIADKQQIVVVFIDEVDAFNRPDRNELTDEHKNALLELCYQLDKHINNPYILTILTTNTSQPLDDSLKSRSNIIIWQLPNAEKRSAIIQFYIKKWGLVALNKKTIDDLSYETANFSGRDIELAFKQAAQQLKQCTISDEKITIETVKKAINEVREGSHIKQNYEWYNPKGFLENYPEIKNLPMKISIGGIAVVVSVLSKDFFEKLVKNETVQGIIQGIANKVTEPLKRFSPQPQKTTKGAVKHPQRLHPR